MGAGVSNWRLARAASMHGLLGVVSGTGLDLILARRLQLGDPDGRMRRALAAFPSQEVAGRIVEKFYVAGGKAIDEPFMAASMLGHLPNVDQHRLLAAANFVEVYLAKEGHDGLVGINYLEKIQTPTLPSLYGAILAGVDAVIVGAGIPRKIPGVLDCLARHEAVEIDIHVQAATAGREHVLRFDPRDILAAPGAPLRRPMFFPIVAAATLAAMLVRKATSSIDGLIIEGPTAGGHNATPRGRMQLSAAGEPVYGERDDVDLAEIRRLGLPFWVAGSCGGPGQLAQARAAGATGIQVGTLFALCEESGLTTEIKKRIVEMCRAGTAQVFTDPAASPTGFPFKVFSLPGSNSEAAVYDQRQRVCDIGCLRDAYERADGTLGWRCPAECADEYVRKGGTREATAGRKCLCNALLANIGLAQLRSDGLPELPLVTCGVDTAMIRRLVKPGRALYTVADVVEYLKS